MPTKTLLSLRLSTCKSPQNRQRVLALPLALHGEGPTKKHKNANEEPELPLTYWERCRYITPRKAFSL